VLSEPAFASAGKVPDLTLQRGMKAFFGTDSKARAELFSWDSPAAPETVPSTPNLRMSKSGCVRPARCPTCPLPGANGERYAAERTVVMRQTAAN
jgi:hypothetical protein